MLSSQRLKWLRRLLLVKVALCLLVWGLPALLAPPALLPLLGLSVPEDPLLLRSFGALTVTMGVAYWYAYQDPVKNVALLKVGLVDNGLATLTVLLSAVTTGVSSWFAWLSAGLTAFFFAAFAFLMPHEQPA